MGVRHALCQWTSSSRLLERGEKKAKRNSVKEILRCPLLLKKRWCPWRMLVHEESSVSCPFSITLTNSEVIYEMFHTLNCGFWNQVSYDHRSYERNLSNCVWKPEKTSTGFEPVTSRYRCDALTNWAMKPLTLGAGHLWVLMSPWRMDVKWYMKSLHINCLNCVHNCDDHSSLD